jgi:hypothetical protein
MELLACGFGKPLGFTEKHGVCASLPAALLPVDATHVAAVPSTPAAISAKPPAVARPTLYLFLVRVYVRQGAGGPRSTTTEGRGGGGGLIIEVIRIAFVVQAVEAVGADHGILAVQVVEGVARKRTRCGSWCRAVRFLRVGKARLTSNAPH